MTTAVPTPGPPQGYAKGGDNGDAGGAMTETSAPGKLVYKFREGNKGMKALLGGKGANLAEMTSIGLPVPPGFTITTEVCNRYSGSCAYPDGLTVG